MAKMPINGNMAKMDAIKMALKMAKMTNADTDFLDFSDTLCACCIYIFVGVSLW